MHETEHQGERALTESGSLPTVKILMVAPRGFCAGVVRSIRAVEDALVRFGAPIYVRRPIVHNLSVVRALEARGAIFVEELDEVPEGSVVIMSAHGIPLQVADEADRRQFRWFDAVCPLVAKVHREVARHHAAGRHVIMIGHQGHPETVGTLGQLPANAVTVVGSVEDVRALTISAQKPVAYAVQTTFSVDDAADVIAALHSYFDDMIAPPSSDICYATTNRQRAIREAADRADAIIVVGESFSSNANRLREVALTGTCRSAQLVSDETTLDWAQLDSAKTIAISAAASTPENSVQRVIDELSTRFDLQFETMGQTRETTVFRPLDFD